MSKPSRKSKKREKTEREVLIDDKEIIDAFEALDFTSPVVSPVIDLKSKKFFLKSKVPNKAALKEILTRNIADKLNEEVFKDTFDFKDRATLTYDKKSDTVSLAIPNLTLHDEQRMSREIRSALHKTKASVIRTKPSPRLLAAVFTAMDCVPKAFDPDLSKYLIAVAKKTKTFKSRVEQFIENARLSGDKRSFVENFSFDQYYFLKKTMDFKLKKTNRSVLSSLTNLSLMGYGNDWYFYPPGRSISFYSADEIDTFVAFCAVFGFIPNNRFLPSFAFEEFKTPDIKKLKERKKELYSKLEKIRQKIGSPELAPYEDGIAFIRTNKDSFIIYIADTEPPSVKDKIKTAVDNFGTIQHTDWSYNFLEVRDLDSPSTLYKVYKALGIVKPIIGVPYSKTLGLVSSILNAVADPDGVIDRVSNSFGPPNPKYKGVIAEYDSKSDKIIVRGLDKILGAANPSATMVEDLTPENLRAMCEVLGRVPEVNGLPKEELACLLLEIKQK